jgi:hypothetical protein
MRLLIQAMAPFQGGFSVRSSSLAERKIGLAGCHEAARRLGQVEVEILQKQSYVERVDVLKGTTAIDW